MHYNAPADLLYRPRQGPTLPHLPNSLSSEKNTWSGTLLPSFQHDQSFDQQYHNYRRFGYAHDPEAPLYNPDGSQNFVGDMEKVKENKGNISYYWIFFFYQYFSNYNLGLTLSDIKSNNSKKEKRKRKPSGKVDSDNYLGPWAPYEGDIDNSSSEEEEDNESKEKSEQTIEKEDDKDIEIKEDKLQGKDNEEEGGGDIDNKNIKERSILHKKERYDYLGRTYLSPPSGLRARDHDCFLPKKRIHTWSGHTKAVSSIKLFPTTGHLLLSSDLDGKVKLWDVYNKRRVLRTFLGHSKGVKDVCFNNDGSKFLSASMDRTVKLWDTESGEVLGRFNQQSTPLCVNFYPEDNNLFLAGLYDKQIVQWDSRANEIVLYYDRHLGPVNSLTFVDENRRFVSTSDDKSIRIWDWNTPVEIKYISEPYMHSIPRIAISHSKKWLACQSLDNQILIYSALDKFKMNRKKSYKGHVVAGYACQPTFSTDGKYIASGDSSGSVFIWDWKSQKILK